MKVRINISIDEEAVEILNKQTNKSQFIEDLILGYLGSPEPEDSTGLTEQRVREIIKEELKSKPLDLATLGLKPATEFVPKPPDPETGYPCCTKKTPCKHWQFDQQEVVWINTLTGKRRELDA